MALTRIPDPNRSTDINFVDVNGRSLYIADRPLVLVEEGNVLHHVKGGIVREGKCTGEYDQREFPDPCRGDHVPHLNYVIFSFCRAMLCISAAYAVMRCLSVCLSVYLSVTFVDHVKTNKHIFEIFSPSGSHTILVFPDQTGWRYSEGNPPNGGVEVKSSATASYQPRRPDSGDSAEQTHIKY